MATVSPQAMATVLPKATATQALYRRWRSRTFDQIIGQDHVTHTLLNALRAGRVGHAYLLAGPRGTGKTTTARVLAKAVNCLDPQNGEPCNRCNICRSLNEGRSLDLIEIDAASNRGIDEIRALREKIAFSPSECRYKVYVIDEVHMLTNEAFNALLKTLEEPPPHAIFVMATTDPQRIPLTVLSRCQRFDFHRIPMSSLKQKLVLICQQEGIRIQPAALEAIARHATGSFRDAESLLDQLVSFGTDEITVEAVRRILGSAPEEVIAGIMQALVAGDVGAGLKWINEALESGVEARQLTREVLEYVRGLLLVKSGGVALLDVSPETLKEMTQQADRLPLGRLLQTARLFNGAANLLKTGIHSQLPLELAFVEATLPEESAGSAGRGGGSNDRTPPARTVSTPPLSGANSVARASPAVTASRASEAATTSRTNETVTAPRTNETVTASRVSETAPGMPAATPPVAPSSPPLAAGEDSAAQVSASPAVEPAEKTQPSSSIAAAASASAPATASRASEKTTAPPNVTTADVAWLKENWGRVLRAIRPRSRVVEALLKSCEPVSIQGNTVTVSFYHGFHKDKMNEDKNRLVVEQALAEVAGQPCAVKFVLCEGNRQEREKQAAADRRKELLQNPVVRDAIAEFGAQVVDVQ
jgi:DNA polymerase-3 subunit gamma/tau